MSEQRIVTEPIATWHLAKGFGFLKPEGLGDVFLHISKLKQVDPNIATPPSDIKVKAQISPGPKGWKVDRVLEIIR